MSDNARLLVLDSYGNEIRPGGEITDFRGDKARLAMPERASSPGRDGKVWVRYLNDGFARSFYASVFGLQVIEVNRSKESSP